MLLTTSRMASGRAVYIYNLTHYARTSHQRVVETGFD